MMNIIRKFRLNRNITSRYASSSISETWPKPVIPKRIARSSTDILKALAGTVNLDRGSPSYKYYDDPYLYPISNIEKRNYALSRESGRKAARWIRDSHGDLFNHQPDDPVIKKYLPKINIGEDSDATENDLIISIENFEVTEAINRYKNIQSKGTELSELTRQRLLELVSFFNCEDSIDPAWISEIDYLMPSKLGRPVKTWKDKGFAEELFSELKETGVKPYCALIRGMCTHNQADGAISLYQECLDNDLVPDTETFNALIRMSPLLKNENELRWEEIQVFLNKMVELKVPPNLGTLNSILSSFSLMRSWARVRTYSLQVLSEFRTLGIEPCLASYFHLIRTFYTQRNASSPLLISILDEIQNKELTLKDPDDKYFFHTAMEVCRRDLQSFEAAERLHQMLQRGNNYQFLSHNFFISTYYRNYLSLAVNSMSLEKFMEIYDYIVPHISSPDRDTMEEIVKNMAVCGDLSLLPRIWSDCIMLEVARNEKLMEMTLMAINSSVLEDETDELRLQLATVAWDIWERIQNQNKNLRQKVEWSGQMLGDCISSLSRCGELEKVSQIISQVIDTPNIVLGLIPLQSFTIAFNECLQANMFRNALDVVKLAKDSDYPEHQEMAKRLKDVAPKDIQDKIVATFGSVVL